MKKLLFVLFIISLNFVACEPDKPELVILNPLEVRAEFSEFLDSYYDGSLALDPLSATAKGDHRFNAAFPDYLSKSYKDSSIAFYKKYKKLAEKYDNQYLTANDTISKAILLWDCNVNLQSLKFRSELFPLDQMWTRNFVMGQFASGVSAQPFKTVEDYENWLQRIDGFVIWLQSAEKRMKEGASLRFVLPSSLIIKVVPQIKAMCVSNVEEHLFYAPVKNFPKSFSEEDKERLKMEYEKMLSEKLIPAFINLHDYVSTDYLTAGRNSSGIDALPNGRAYYNTSIKKYTTTNLTAEEIHQIGLDEVARILSEMNQVKEELEFEGDLMAFFDHVRTSKELMPFSKPEQVINHFEEIHQKLKPHLKRLFKETPKTEFVVRRTESFRESSASAQYNAGSLEDNRPGIFYVPIPDASKYNIQRDESLFLHEAIPGHHYQIALAQENDSLPKFRKNLWLSAYGEGWALYTEALGKEMGMYKDPYQYFGMLGAEMHRAVRLVVDTGLHSKGWTREQAIQYSLDNEALSKDVITREVERYMANPGQALSYKIGQLKILELRAKAEVELGDEFDIKEFHHMILNKGSLPLAILEESIMQWIKESKQVNKS
ncbi:DUF885 domain-containing protein [Lutimonas halocynthiae]|uniref:DUF885 domain-containing protein n=1 Tax=Lutimonas halocynthiae TaxID=1446477 RepID=UPI0025B32974|nr:DUF885 domain-containing protein [Lutimonas halocynthiae]MDN3643829.1 DUF885 domain-containing protein [Lutimonas halocynthiae]